MRAAGFGYSIILSMVCTCLVYAAPPRDFSSQQGPAQEAFKTSRTLHCRQTHFLIPFSINPKDESILEVQLLVSADRGANWHVYDRKKPTARRFEFRAPYDAHYWFAIRTIDRHYTGGQHNQPSPELRVTVDTTPPKIEFSANVGPAGEIITAWNIFDTNLQADSFTIEYQTAVGQPWQRVAVDIPRDGNEKTTLSGNNTWWPKATSSTINIRGTVSDLSGNRVPITRLVTLPRVDSQRGSLLQRDNVANYPNDPFAQHRNDITKQTTSWPADNETHSLPGREDLLVNQPLQRPQSHPTDLLIANRFVSQGRRIDIPVDLPEGARPRLTNQPRFKLAYKIDETGPQGVASVELWITENGGRIWRHFGIDPDMQSPFDVQLDREGTFGFRIVIAGRNGLLTPLPKRGDPADMWVTLDYSKPVARITSALYGTGRHVGYLNIRWESEDVNLPSHPVTLLYSSHPAGPWTTIATGLPVSGRHDWKIEPSMGRQVYLAMTVVDSAGNEGSDRLAEPIRLGGLAPKGRILDLLPADDANLGASRIPLFRY